MEEVQRSIGMTWKTVEDELPGDEIEVLVAFMESGELHHCCGRFDKHKGWGLDCFFDKVVAWTDFNEYPEPEPEKALFVEVPFIPDKISWYKWFSPGE